MCNIYTVHMTQKLEAHWRKISRWWLIDSVTALTIHLYFNSFLSERWKRKFGFVSVSQKKGGGRCFISFFPLDSAGTLWTFELLGWNTAEVFQTKTLHAAAAASEQLGLPHQSLSKPRVRMRSACTTVKYHLPESAIYAKAHRCCLA